MPNVLMNPYMIQAMQAMQQMPGGQQAYGRQMRGLGAQFGLAQRRATMQAGQLNIPPHLQFAIGQQQLPGMYGQYAGALGAAAGQAGQMDIQRAATMGQFGIGAARVALEQQRLEMQREQMRRQMRPNFWNILGTAGTLGMGIAGLMMPPVGAAMGAMGGAGGAGGGMGIPMGQAMNWMMPQAFQPAGYGGY